MMVDLLLLDANDAVVEGLSGECIDGCSKVEGLSRRQDGHDVLIG